MKTFTFFFIWEGWSKRFSEYVDGEDEMEIKAHSLRDAISILKDFRYEKGARISCVYGVSHKNGKMKKLSVKF